MARVPLYKKAETELLRRITSGARAATAFVQLYFIPVKKHKVPASTRLEPVY